MYCIWENDMKKNEEVLALWKLKEDIERLRVIKTELESVELLVRT